MKIVIAGASGYIGQALVSELLKRVPTLELTALSRSAKKSDDARVTWRECDLFSLKSLEQAVPQDVDVAYYLVHSMGPTARMDQGSFADYDLLLADNFARIMKHVRAKHVIYLGGLIPERHDPSFHLSPHLKSRFEVEEVFRQAGLQLTVFRAGLIVGRNGSSFQILTKLVKRLPVMICPRWTQTLTTPIDLRSAIEALVEAASQNENQTRVFDLAGCEPLTYVEMMRETAERMGRKRLFFTVPFFTPTLSRLWVRLITGVPKELVYPLVQSLEHEMIARPEFIFRNPPPGLTYRSLIEEIPVEPEKKLPESLFKVRRNTVRSMQRLPLPLGKNARWVKDQYLIWLPRFLMPFIRVIANGNRVSFSFLTSKLSMLELTLNEERSSPDRQLLYVTGGLLSAKDNQGRLEFRSVLNGTYVLAAIHDFKPSLPWPIYRFTQAIAHAWVMRNFTRYLAKKMGSTLKNEARAPSQNRAPISN